MQKYKVQIFFSHMDQNYPQGKDLEFESAPEAFIRAVLILKMAVRGDLIQAKKYGNSTILNFIEDSSLQVRITPNVLAPGHDKIGPYSFSSGIMLEDLIEN